MREIKFRGMTIRGEWVYGNLAIVTKRVRGWSVEPGSYISNSAGAPFAYDVRPETVGQFTGLKDREGREIYEGDIVATRDEILEVLYAEDGFYVFDHKTGGYGPLIVQKGRCEVIGNIHENPELLKEKP